MKDNEKGVTLIELLAVIVIASFVMGIIYSVAKLALDYHTVETTKAELQQEANYIVTELQRIHRKGDCYMISITEEEVKVVEECGPDIDIVPDRVISNGNIYSSSIVEERLEIEPNNDNLRLAPFRIKSRDNENIEVEITTTIARYKNRESGG